MISGSYVFENGSEFTIQTVKNLIQILSTSHFQSIIFFEKINPPVINLYSQNEIYIFLTIKINVYLLFILLKILYNII